jgi:hypothetical protein
MVVGIYFVGWSVIQDTLTPALSRLGRPSREREEVGVVSSI